MSDKYDKLKGGLDESSHGQIDEWEKNEKLSSLKLDLAKHAGMKILIEGLDSKIKGIDGLLLKKREMTEVDRNLLFAKRDCYEYIIKFFRDAKVVNDGVNKSVAEAEKLI